MLGWTGGKKAAVAQAAESVRSTVAAVAEPVVGYVDPLAKDEQLRRRLVTAMAAGAAARQRARTTTGLRGLVARLAADQVLHAQLAQVVKELQAAQRRAKHVRSHKLRNSILVLAGTGVAVALVATRDQWARKATGGGDAAGSGNPWSPASSMSSGTAEDVEAPTAPASSPPRSGGSGSLETGS